MSGILSAEEVAGYDGINPDDSYMASDAIRLATSHEILRRRLAEVEQALRDLIAWVGQIGYPYDFTTIPALPDQFVRPLAEWWWRDSDKSGTVDEWEDGIADEAQIAVRAVLDKGEPE